MKYLRVFSMKSGSFHNKSTRLVLTCTLTFFSLVSPKPVNSEWRQNSILPRPRTEAASAAVGEHVFVFGGLSNPTDGYHQVDRYDSASNSWKWGVTKLPDSRHHFTAGNSVYGDEIWICGGKTGDDSSGLRSVWVLNASTLKWRQGPDLPEVHWAGPAVVVGSTLHVVGGASGSTEASAHHFALDLTDEGAGWKELAPLPLPRVHAAGVSIGGLLYFLGGELSHRHTGDRSEVQVYDPILDAWQQVRSLPRPRSHSEWSTFVHEGKIFSVGGVDSDETPRGQREIFVYHPELDHWSTLFPLLPEPHVGLSAKIVRNRLYLFGGSRWDWFFGELNQVSFLESVELRAVGDVNGDMLFSSADLVEVFQQGLFESEKKSGWSAGDWNGDGVFNMADFDLAREYNAYYSG